MRINAGSIFILAVAAFAGYYIGKKHGQGGRMKGLGG